MPYDLEPMLNDPLSEADQKQRLKDMRREQAETLREGLGAELYDWCEAFEQDMDFLVED